ncbi:hypothetical protein D477_004786 [Arthrobacter crystallopoietes BAB-32]|uniref:Uncharacterized protein n=1 Tax=Arthrobacter crystallopoietes BAB-32 TaxID=1246476 RepID=N1UY72_9MICC|nr:hypothetical protein [Arthrobacter crystallopoietes]EMY35316.1 hypothetical protein D477_004786 [Arthrobacter crystallopoietes BAB-32]
MEWIVFWIVIGVVVAVAGAVAWGRRYFRHEIDRAKRIRRANDYGKQ